MEAPIYDRAFYQGLLQIAVGCYHLSNSNWRGAVILLAEGMGRLEKYEPIYYKIDVSQLLDESSQLLDQLKKIGEEEIRNWLEHLQGTFLPTIVTVQQENNDS